MDKEKVDEEDEEEEVDESNEEIDCEADEYDVKKRNHKFVFMASSCD